MCISTGRRFQCNVVYITGMKNKIMGQISERLPDFTRSCGQSIVCLVNRRPECFHHRIARHHVSNIPEHDRDHRSAQYWPQSIHIPDSKVHGANIGPTWGRQDLGGPHVGPMSIAIRDLLLYGTYPSMCLFRLLGFWNAKVARFWLQLNVSDQYYWLRISLWLLWPLVYFYIKLFTSYIHIYIHEWFIREICRCFALGQFSGAENGHYFIWILYIFMHKSVDNRLS